MTRSTLDSNPYALALGRPSLPATRETGNAYLPQASLTRQERAIARQMRTDMGQIEAEGVRNIFALDTLGAVHAFAAGRLHQTFTCFASASHIPGASPALRGLWEQWLEAAAVGAGMQVNAITTQAAENIFQVLGRGISVEDVSPDEPGLLRRLFGGG